MASRSRKAARAERSTDGVGRAQGGERIGRGRRIDPVAEPSSAPLDRRRDGDEPVVASLKGVRLRSTSASPHARATSRAHGGSLSPLPGSRPDEGARRRDKVVFIRHRRAETRLEEMAGHPAGARL